MSAKTDSPRAIAARTNGAKSRGPKTAEGKARSSQNGLKHGFTAAKWIKLPGDEEGAFERYAQGMLEDLRPKGPYQEALAEFIINCMWQLRRIPVFEATLVRDEVATFHSTGIKFYRHDWPQAHLALARYVAHLDRCRYKAVKELRELQSISNPQSEIPNPQSPSRPQKQKLQNEPKPDDYDLEDIYQRVLERAAQIRSENPQNEPKLVVFDPEEVTQRALEVRRALRAPSPDLAPCAGSGEGVGGGESALPNKPKTTAKARSKFRTRKSK